MIRDVCTAHTNAVQEIDARLGKNRKDIDYNKEICDG
jgi:hypothetical protein